VQTLRPEIVCRQVTIVPRAHPALVPRERLYRVLLRLWRLAPLPQAARGFILWCANQRFLIGVVGLIWDDQGRLLLARHSYLPPPGWSLPGGWLGADESLEAGVARELAEELGMAVEVGPLVGWARQRAAAHPAPLHVRLRLPAARRRLPAQRRDPGDPLLPTRRGPAGRPWRAPAARPHSAGAPRRAARS